MLKTWADENDILYGEGQYNMNWSNVINEIKESPKDFVKGGCWNFIADNLDDEEEEDDDGDDDDPEYQEMIQNIKKKKRKIIQMMMIMM